MYYIHTYVFTFICTYVLRGHCTPCPGRQFDSMVSCGRWTCFVVDFLHLDVVYAEVKSSVQWETRVIRPVTASFALITDKVIGCHCRPCCTKILLLSNIKRCSHIYTGVKDQRTGKEEIRITLRIIPNHQLNVCRKCIYVSPLCGLRIAETIAKPIEN